MTLLPILRFLPFVTALAAALPSQDWSDDQLVSESKGFQSLSLTTQIEQVGKLLDAKSQALTAIVARIHGDHREYRLKVDRLLDELCDPNWRVRENAERSLVEIGGRARTVIQQRRDEYQVLEQHIRCGRILEALDAKGTEHEDRERKMLQGLVRTALYLPSDERLLRSLRSALGHTDTSIAGGAIRAIGKHGGDNEADAIAMMVTFKSGLHRSIAISALGRMQSDKALAYCRAMLLDGATEGPLKDVVLNRTEAMCIVRALRTRSDEGAKALLAELAKHQDPVIAKGASVAMPAAEKAIEATLTMPDRTQVVGNIDKMFGDSFLIEGAFVGVPTAELSLSDCSTIDFPKHAVQKNTSTTVFLNQGSRISGNVLAIDPESVRLASPVFGELTLARSEIQGMAFDPELDRLVGASVDHDRLRLRTGKFLDGKIARIQDGKVVVELIDGTTQQVPVADVGGMLFQRPRATEPDPTSYVRLDLTTGERLIGFVAESSGDHIAVTVPLIGATALPWSTVHHVELGVGGGAMWGFTLIADYSDNRIVEVDDQGRVVFVLEEIFGAWDAECLDSGNLLITEFSVSRVQEVNRKGETVWQFEELKNPYDADRLPNGNTLIADTFASRVIEVSPEGKIVWSYAKDIRPFDCDRLANGNTLIADVLKDRVIEVSPEGEIVWEGKGLPNAHDADRLPNGNTLVTLRNKGAVLEIDRDGKIVFELTGLSSPSDADRLPNGNTIVAENTCVREFDRHGNEVWKKEMTWAVEVNRY
jgi:HEAT repeat protein